MLSLSTVLLLIIVITVLVKITFLGDKASTTCPDTIQSTNEDNSTASNKLVEPLTDAPDSDFNSTWSITPPRPRAVASRPVPHSSTPSRIPRRKIIDRVSTTFSCCIPNPSEDFLGPIPDADDSDGTSSDSSDTCPSPSSSRSSLSSVAATNATHDCILSGRTKEKESFLEQELTSALQKLERTEKRLEQSERTSSKLRTKLQTRVSDPQAKKRFEERVLDSRRVKDKHVAEKVQLQNDIRGLESEVARLKTEMSRWQNFQREAMKQVQRRRLALRLASEAVSAVAQYQLVRMKEGWEKEKQGWNQQSEKLQRTVAREKQRADTQTSHRDSLETAHATLMKRCSDQDAMIHQMNVQVEVANRERKVIEDESKSLRNEVMKLTKALNEQAGSILARSNGYGQTNSHPAVASESMFMSSPQAPHYYREEAPVTNLIGSFAPAHSEPLQYNLCAPEPTPDLVSSFNNAGSSQSQPLHHNFSAPEPTPDFISSFNASSSRPVHNNVQAEQPIPDFVSAFNGDLTQPRPPVMPIAENPFLKAPADDFAAGPSCEATRPSPAVNTFFATPPNAPVAPSTLAPLPFSIREPAAPVTVVPPQLPTIGNDWTKVEPEPESKEERLQRALERMKQNSESAQASYGKQSDRRAKNAKRMGRR